MTWRLPGVCTGKSACTQLGGLLGAWLADKQSTGLKLRVLRSNALGLLLGALLGLSIGEVLGPSHGAILRLELGVLLGLELGKSLGWMLSEELRFTLTCSGRLTARGSAWKNAIVYTQTGPQRSTRTMTWR